MTCTVGFVQTVIRLIQGYARIDFKNLCCRCCKRNKLGLINGPGESLINEGGLQRKMTKTQEFEWLEQRVLETVRSQRYYNYLFNFL